MKWRLTGNFGLTPDIAYELFMLSLYGFVGAWAYIIAEQILSIVKICHGTKMYRRTYNAFV